MSLVVDIKVTPKSGRQSCKLGKDGILACYLKSAPEKGKANAELVAYLAKTLRSPKSSISIVSGETSRQKRISIDLDIDLDRLLLSLGIEKQLTIL